MKDYYSKDDICKIFGLKEASVKDCAYLPKYDVRKDNKTYWHKDNLKKAIRNSGSGKAVFAMFGDEIKAKLAEGRTKISLAEEYGVSKRNIIYYTKPSKKHVNNCKARAKATVIYKEYTAPKHWELVNSVLNRSTGIVHPA